MSVSRSQCSGEQVHQQFLSAPLSRTACTFVVLAQALIPFTGALGTFDQSISAIHACTSGLFSGGSLSSGG